MTTKQSVLILIVVILLIGGFFRLVKLLQIEQVNAQELKPKVEQLKKENENLKNENIILRKQVSLPYRDKVMAYIWKVFDKKAEEALAIISCENASMDMARINRNRDNSYDFGIFQINSIHIKRFGKDFVSNWKANIEIAYKLYQEQKWNPWYSSRSCWKEKLANKAGIYIIKKNYRL